MRLAYSKIKIGDKEFGELPRRTENSMIYTIKPISGQPVIGDSVMVMTTTDSCL